MYGMLFAHTSLCRVVPPSPHVTDLREPVDDQRVRTHLAKAGSENQPSLAGSDDQDLGLAVCEALIGDAPVKPVGTPEGVGMLNTGGPAFADPLLIPMQRVQGGEGHPCARLTSLGVRQPDEPIGHPLDRLELKVPLDEIAPGTAHPPWRRSVRGHGDADRPCAVDLGRPGGGDLLGTHERSKAAGQGQDVLPVAVVLEQRHELRGMS
jgi:hypothetical protein